MNKAEIREYWPIESYKEAAKILDTVSTIVLSSLSAHNGETRNVVIRNFLARGTMSLKGVLILWSIGDYQDCWVIYRGILDRLFHLSYLADTDEFELFEKWSFEKQYESRNKVRGDKDFKGRLDLSFFSHTEAERSRYKAIKEENLKWRRPKAREVAKTMDLQFLYDHGYDYASTLVHPMANDGQEDFLRRMRVAKEEQLTDQIVVVNNAILATLLLIREGMNASNLSWRNILHDFLDHVLDFLRTGSETYKLTFVKIGMLGPDTEWAQTAQD